MALIITNSFSGLITASLIKTNFKIINSIQEIIEDLTINPFSPQSLYIKFILNKTLSEKERVIIERVKAPERHEYYNKIADLLQDSKTVLIADEDHNKRLMNSITWLPLSMSEEMRSLFYLSSILIGRQSFYKKEMFSK